MPTTTKNSGAGTGFFCLFGFFAVIVMLFPSCQAVTHGVGQTYKTVGMLSDWHVDVSPAIHDFDARFVRAYEKAETEADVEAVQRRVATWSDGHVWPSIRGDVNTYDFSVRTDALNRIKYRATR
jgi:hypothetical protein